MEWLSVLVLAVAPALALLAYFYLKDRYDAEPIHWVARIYLMGLLLVFPAMVLQRALVMGLGENPFLFAFGISGGIEEFVKWFIVFYVIYKHTVFDEPYDGIVYCVAVSLGYATLENVIYAFFNDLSLSAIWFRALIPVSGHALFGVIMGYYMGKAKFSPGQEAKYLLFSLFFPILWHGLLDFILLTFTNGWAWLILPFMLLLWVKSIWKVNSANEQSPFRVVGRDEEIKI